MKLFFIMTLSSLNILGMIISLLSGYFIISIIFTFLAIFFPYRYAKKTHKQYVSQAEEVSKILYPEHYEVIKQVLAKK